MVRICVALIALAVVSCGVDSPSEPSPAESCGELSLTASEACDVSEEGPPATCEASVWSLGNGWCDAVNNHAVCGWDGGDCCLSTCVNDAYICDQLANDCRDPLACENHAMGCQECAPGCALIRAGDGECDVDCYTEACHFDAPSVGAPSDCTCSDVSLQSSCDGQCVGEEELLSVGDGVCDDGESGNDFNCSAWEFDGGDCGLEDPKEAGYPDCTGVLLRISDGWCDYANNSAACGWDGGDCCESTCVDDHYSCGFVGYSCLDPGADENLAPSDSSCEAAPETLGDGVCDQTHNDQACLWDGGDCCVSTNDTCDSTCHCLDPDAVENIVSDTEDGCSGNLAWVGDGWCDGLKNTSSCDWDGGDCCESTCRNGNYPCGSTSEYHCLNPLALENAPDVSTCTGDVDYNQNGRCDSENNNGPCGWDGGDCCEASNSLCGSDPEYPCVCLDPAGGVPPELQACEGAPARVEDGVCDPQNNTLGCGWDGGDCCVSSNALCLVESAAGVCECLDPLADENLAPGAGACSGNPMWVSDGWCDSINNNKGCGFDGGDCCKSTCGSATFLCGAYIDFACLDPKAIENQVDLSECVGDVDDVGDGRCDVDNNTSSCAYDGGDCCVETCVGVAYACGEEGYQCVDPEVVPQECAEGEFKDCSSRCFGDSFLVWLGDGRCDEGSLHLNCAEFEFDQGDCKGL